MAAGYGFTPSAADTSERTFFFCEQANDHKTMTLDETTTSYPN